MHPDISGLYSLEHRTLSNELPCQVIPSNFT
eukprot:TsM_000222400 transcript=TsM_000222400 gene=TsM_000222400